MTLMEFFSHPVTQALWDGAKYTAPKVMTAVRENMMARPVGEQDIQQAAENTTQPVFDIEEVTP